MGEMREITVEVPTELLERALASTDQGITQTIRRGLELVAAGRAYEDLRRLRGQVCLGLSESEPAGDEAFRHFARLGGLRLAV